ncbi:MAG: hypothetical protein JW827_01255 [Spirochaetes bacterium]|nr:hypothetical protein [Spirochaetota bacterium]
MRYLRLIIAILFSAHLIQAKVTVNFFVDYNIMTFSEFDKIVEFNASHSIGQYIEYNEIMPVYLVWKNKNLLDLLKDQITNDKLKFFKLDRSKLLKNKQDIWFSQEKGLLQDKIFSNIMDNSNLIQITIKTDHINIFNFIEMEKVLSTLSQQTQNKEINFDLDLKLFLYSKVNNYLELLNRFQNINYRFFIVSDATYKASQSQIKELVDTVYSLRFKKDLAPNEKKIFDLSILFFTLKLSPALNDILLNLFPLTSILPKRYQISSTEYEMNDNKYITLFDKENFFTFDSDTGYLKKWYHYKSGTSMINFDSLIERVYIASGKNERFKNQTCMDADYSRFPNGINFRLNYPDDLEMDKNIILQNNHLFISYKLRNNSSRKKYYILIIENKLSPSLLNMLLELKSNICLYKLSKKNKFVDQLDTFTRGIINMDTGYGAYIDTYNAVDGMEIFKGFYFYDHQVYYKFSLYPYENKVITLAFRKLHYSESKRRKYLEKNFDIKDQKWGDCEIQ